MKKGNGIAYVSAYQQPAISIMPAGQRVRGQRVSGLAGQRVSGAACSRSTRQTNMVSTYSIHIQVVHT
jgi:hypothetical protein